MSYIYMIQESMSWHFSPFGYLTINGCYTSKKEAIKALKEHLKTHADDIELEKHRTYIRWSPPGNPLTERYYRIVKVLLNQWHKPDMLKDNKDKVIIFPEADN